MSLCFVFVYQSCLVRSRSRVGPTGPCAVRVPAGLPWRAMRASRPVAVFGSVNLNGIGPTAVLILRCVNSPQSRR